MTYWTPSVIETQAREIASLAAQIDGMLMYKGYGADSVWLDRELLSMQNRLSLAIELFRSQDFASIFAELTEDMPMV